MQYIRNVEGVYFLNWEYVACSSLASNSGKKSKGKVRVEQVSEGIETQGVSYFRK